MTLDQPDEDTLTNTEVNGADILPHLVQRCLCRLMSDLAPIMKEESAECMKLILAKESPAVIVGVD